MKSSMFNRRLQERAAKRVASGTDAFIDDRDADAPEAKKEASGTDNFIDDHENNVEEMNTDEVRVASKTASETGVTSAGYYVTLLQTDDNWLVLTPNTEQIKIFIEDNEHHLSTDTRGLLGIETPVGGKRLHVWGDDAVLHELLEDHLTNGWGWVQPEDIGALTAAPILEAPDGRIYWHERYAIESGADELLTGKSFKMEGAPENKIETPMESLDDLNPEGWEEEPPVDLGKKSSKKAGDVVPIDSARPPATPAAPPMDAGMPDSTSVTGKYKYWTAEALSTVIKSLSGVTDFDADKAAQQAVAEMAAELEARPKSTALPKAADKKKAQGGGGFTINNETTSKVLEGDKSISDGRDKVEDHTGIKYPPTKMPKDAQKKEAAPGTGTPCVNDESSKVLEGDKSIPDGRDKVEDHTGIKRPPTVNPGKFASIKVARDVTEKGMYQGQEFELTTWEERDRFHIALHNLTTNTDVFDLWDGDAIQAVEDGFINTKNYLHSAIEYAEELGLLNKIASKLAAKITVKKEAGAMEAGKAMRLAEGLSEKLTALFLDAKPLTSANDSRTVRDAVEAIYQASGKLSEASRLLGKQEKQEEAEEAAAKASMPKKKSSSLGLNLVGVVQEEKKPKLAGSLNLVAVEA